MMSLMTVIVFDIAKCKVQIKDFNFSIFIFNYFERPL